MHRPSIVLSVKDRFRTAFFTPDAIARLKAAGDLVLDPDPAHHETPGSHQILANAEVLVTGWETGSIDSLLNSMPELRMLVHSGGSVRDVVGPQIFEHGVRVSSQTQLNAEPVAEYTLAMIILAAKDIFATRRAYTEARAKAPDFWDAFPSIGLYGSTIGLIGLSRISRLIIEHLRPFHCTIKVSSGHLSAEEAKRLGVIPASLEEVLRTSDVVSLHSASTPRTHHMLRAEHFAMMKDGATFINTARGAICDQEALIAELAKDRIRAIIDVTEPEVSVPDSPLWTLPNVFLTPHAAGSMGRELHRLGDGAVDDVEHFLAGVPVAGEFTAEQYAGRA
ncbi:hydroxyacid dehydrogenase [Actinomyces sp. MRS3W]|uniref:hydroxyacid dehydrogenase n=1 Tax=Actinomyces sp. MRS3W TaxID=2800796 RepID=UPI0028FDAA2F|nr:hydroxyacid dehydrogenase [Actinomyces sp. MRS3W]MDU0348920.1 hydroxyacid dehydrogenase [Actinomyces sp. MRS3W]